MGSFVYRAFKALRKEKSQNIEKRAEVATEVEEEAISR
jgi:hypothetical protein